MVDTTFFDQVPKHNRYFVKREYDLDIFELEVQKLDGISWLPHYSASNVHRLKHFAKKVLRLYQYLDDYNVLAEREAFAFDEEILRCGRNAYLVGHWQNEKYFKDIEEQIRRDFVLNPSDDEVKRLANEIANNNSVCLNVRRTDFSTNPIHGFVGMKYISQAMAYVKRAVKKPTIYVFSDEIEWCKDNLKFSEPCYFVPHDYAGSKFSSYLYLMMKCHHFVIPNSTFGWWAAWLSNNPKKVVIAPKRWVNVSGLDSSQILPSNWIAM